jgi:Starch-binding associating with outer membrane
MMRSHIIRTSLVAASLVAGLTACDADKLTEVNVNPNNPEVVSSQSLFTNSVVGLMQSLRGSGLTHGFAGVWSQHFSEIQYPETDLHQPRTANIDTFWARFYTGTITGPTMGSMQDLNQILVQSPTSVNIIAPTLVFRAFALQTLTDMWGDVPFTEAGRGSEVLTPKYDAQSVVYDSIFAMLTRAVAIPAPSEDVTSPNYVRMGDADPVYPGKSAAAQAASWTKLANSLRARAGLRLSQVDAAKSKAQLTAALAGPVFTSNADNASVSWPGGTLGNPLCLNWLNAGCGGTRDDQRVSKRLVDTLKANSDPRLAAFADPTGNSQKAAPSTCDIPYRGYPNGLTAPNEKNPCDPTGKANFSLSDYSRPNISIRSPDSPSWIMTYSEVLFIKAEAAERGLVGTPGQAAAFYTEAIRASLQQWGIEAADITAYLARPQVAYKGGAAGIQQIAYEKWVALYNQETEAWSEYRRLDSPVLKPGPDAATTTVPTRMPYPSSEQSLNATNLAAAQANQGGATGTSLSGKVWWDKP